MPAVDLFEESISCAMPDCAGKISITRPANAVPRSWVELLAATLLWFQASEGDWYCRDCQKIAQEHMKNMVGNAR